jgi:hypothetical protein
VVTKDGTGVVSHAGTVLLAELADRIRLTAALSEATDGLRERRPGHDPGRVLVDVAEEVRAYAFLGQVVPFADPHLEELYYYGKYLLTKLPTRDAGGTVDLSGAVVLTHLRTDLVAEREDLSLGEGQSEPLPGQPGEGRGRQADEPRSLLSQLIDALNERFGARPRRGGPDLVRAAAGRAAQRPRRAGGRPAQRRAAVLRLPQAPHRAGDRRAPPGQRRAVRELLRQRRAA